MKPTKEQIDEILKEAVTNYDVKTNRESIVKLTWQKAQDEILDEEIECLEQFRTTCKEYIKNDNDINFPIGFMQISFRRLKELRKRREVKK